MSSSEAGTVPVTINAEKDTEIFVIDSAFNLMFRGVGSVRGELAPGLYKVKYKAGTLIREEHSIVEPGVDHVELSSPPLQFASPAPLAGTGTTHEYHEVAAAALSRQVHRRIAPGSQLFVFARSFTGEAAAPHTARTDNPAQGLTLNDPEGNLLVDLEREGVRGPGPDVSVGCTVELAPGVYRLRVRTRQWGSLEQTVVTSPGWQTQIFLLPTDDDGGTTPNLSDAAIMLAPMGDGFVADSEALRSCELARGALINRRVFMPRHQLQELLSEGITNPMLGIYAVHALVAAGQDERDLVRGVRDKLVQSLGRHPDVEALSFYLDGAAATDYRYEAPPMLMSSWSLVVSASARQPSLVPPHSLASRAGSALWGDGPWLIWLADRLGEAEPKADVPLSEAVSRLAGVASDVKWDTAGIPQLDTDLDDVEEALLSAVLPPSQRTATRASHPRPMAMPAGPAGDIPGPPDRGSETARLAERLGVAPATLENVAASLLSKLAPPGPGRTPSGP